MLHRDWSSLSHHEFGRRTELGAKRLSDGQAAARSSILIIVPRTRSTAVCNCGGIGLPNLARQAQFAIRRPRLAPRFVGPPRHALQVERAREPVACQRRAAYRDHVLAMPEMAEWTAEALMEPDEVEELEVEF